MGTGSFPEVKRPGHDNDHPPPSSAQVKERVHYTSTPFWAFVAYSRVFLNYKLSKLLYGTLPNNNKEKCLTPTRKPITGKNYKKKKSTINQKNAKLNKQQTTNHQRRQDNALKLMP
jgi:hypothetical protein